MVAHSFFIFETHQTPENCTINECPEPLNSEAWRVSEGVRMAEYYPGDVSLRMAKNHRGIGVPDLIDNTLLMPLISGRLKVLLEQEAGAEIEFLPFTLYNHKGRVAARNCYVANVIGVQDCVDWTRTEGIESAITPGEYMFLSRLFLDPSRIDPKVKLFRISAKPAVLVIRDDLRQLLEENDITGVQYITMGEECEIY